MDHGRPQVVFDVVSNFRRRIIGYEDNSFTLLAGQRHESGRRDQRIEPLHSLRRGSARQWTVRYNGHRVVPGIPIIVISMITIIICGDISGCIVTVMVIVRRHAIYCRLPLIVTVVVIVVVAAMMDNVMDQILLQGDKGGVMFLIPYSLVPFT